MGYWSAERQNAHALRFKLHFHVVNLAIASLHFFRGCNIAMHKAAGGELETPFGSRAHGKQATSKAQNLGLKVDCHY
jgi:hypothetical protein